MVTTKQLQNIMNDSVFTEAKIQYVNRINHWEITAGRVSQSTMKAFMKLGLLIYFDNDRLVIHEAFN